MAEIRIFQSLTEVSAAQWNACFAQDVENYEYLLATEQSGIQGFSWAYVTAWQDGVLVAAMPAFFSDYALDTTLQGVGKKITTAIATVFPKLLKVKLGCLGSPCTEVGLMGFHPSLTTAAHPALIEQIVAAFDDHAATLGCRLIGMKDISEKADVAWRPILLARHYASLPGLPTAYLDIDFANVDEYLSRLSSGSRKDMRRKLKAASEVEIRFTHDLTGVLDQVMAMYHDTRSRSEWQFEELTAAYFTGVLRQMPDRSFCTLYYVKGELLAANLLVHNEHTLLDKFFCMDGVRGREYNLYFLSWFTNIRTCLERGIGRYQSGQAHYDNKVRLKSHLSRNQMYFKHRNQLVQGILTFAAPYLGADETLKEAA